MKKFLIRFAIAFIVIIAGAGIALEFINWNQFKPQIKEQVQKTTGRDLEIDGDLKLSIFPSPRLVASGIKFQNAPEGKEPYMATVQKLKVGVALLPLLSSRLTVTKVILDTPVVHIEKFPTGGNWLFPVAMAQNPQSQESGEAVTPVQKPSSFQVGVNKAEVSNGTLSYYQAPFCDSLSYNFLWEETLPEVPVTAVKEKHNFHNGLTILNRHHQYYDMIAFAMPGDLANKNTLYLNYLGYLKSFAEDFVVDHRQLFKHLDTHRLVPPDALKDPNREILCLPTTQEYSLSPQESLCLRLLKKGYTYKRIGLKLGLSPRTVETYLTRIKEKTGATSKDHLLTLPLL